jgi:hypothetical protein
MDVRERDDGSGGGDLPGGLSFLDEDPLPPPVPPRRGQGLARGLRVLLVLAVLAAGALVGVRWMADQDVRDVVASSTATYTRVLDVVAAARDPETLASAAALGPRAAEWLQSDLARLDSDEGRRRAAVAAQVEAERDVLLALGPLERLADGPLGVWGRAHEPLNAAIAAESRTRSALRLADEGAAGRLPDTSEALRRITSTVGAALVDDVQRTAGELLDDLAAAARTADLRAAAERATGQRTAVLAAQQGLGGTSDGIVLAEFAAALEAVQGLVSITPADTGGWPDVRGRVLGHLQFVADSADSLAAGSVRARLPLVLTSIDGLLARAAEAHAAWQPLHDVAVARQASDILALQRYGDAVRSAAADEAGLRSSLSALLTSQEGADTSRSAVALAALSEAADDVLAALGSYPPPAGTEDAHAGLVAGAEALAANLRSVVEELRSDACQDCPVGTHPAWRSLDRASAAAGSLDAALARWETAVRDATAAVAARVPPPPPDV